MLLGAEIFLGSISGNEHVKMSHVWNDYQEG